MSIIFEKIGKIFEKFFDFLKNLQKAKIFSDANLDQKMKNRVNSDFRQNLQEGSTGRLNFLGQNILCYLKIY